MKTKEELRAYRNEWCARNKDKVQLAHARWKAKNPVKAKVRNTELVREWRETHRERVREIARACYARNREKIRARSAAWRAAHPGSHRAKRYGVSFADWNAMFTAQGQACAICGTKDPRGRGRQLDHNHETGRVRGILCHGRNVVLGMSRESVDTLAEAIQYLQDHRWVLVSTN